MGYTVCFANNKGGVGKTTTSVAIGQAWARMGKKVLFVDLDSQANLTSMVSPLSPEEHKLTIRDAFIDKNNFSIEKIDDNIDLIPSELSLSNFDRDTATVTGREYLLVDLLKPVKKNYDFIIIDCPPALGLITYNALIASDHLVMVATPLAARSAFGAIPSRKESRSHSRWATSNRVLFAWIPWESKSNL